jgi:phosphatidylglycerol:prolipoprotein diacylglycerol transferase
MYPDAFHIGSFAVSSFGVMVAVGTLVGLWLFKRELARRGLPEQALDGALVGVLAGLAGAKLLYVAEHLGEEPWVSLLANRAGLSWFGGLFAGAGAAVLLFRLRRLPILPIVAAATPALAVGHLLGRVGCFLVGDDYGRPSELPWTVAFPRGLPPTTARVHPTQLYEAAWLAVVAWLLIRWRRAGVDDRLLVGRYLLLTGSARFLIEFVRVNERVALGLTVAQWACLAAILAGTMMQRARRPDRRPSKTS